MIIKEIVEKLEVKETGIDMDQFKEGVRVEHAQDLERIQQYKAYYKNVLNETGLRPSKFEPDNGYCYVKLKYKNTDIELLQLKSRTDRVIYFFKGCAYINHMTDSASREMQNMAHYIGGIDVFSVNHRIAPEHNYKDVLEDTVNGYIWLLEHCYKPENITFLGDSSGGGTAIATAMMLREMKLPLPGNMVLFSPWANVAMDTSSYQQFNESDCMLGGNGLLEYARSVYLDKKNPHNPFISPCYGDFSDMPRTLIQLGTEERVYDDIIMIAEKMTLRGRDIKVEIYDRMFHEFQFYTELASSKAAWEHVKNFVEHKR